MGWSEAAADVARNWAAQCHYGHSGTNGFGENIFASTATSATISDAVQAWASEASDYDQATNSCRTGKVCGHYTQLVWRSSTGVGCASQVCQTGSPFGSGTWLIWVCDYVPPGNYIGEPPY
jgi:pathogenesis-related protein 1